MRATLVPFASVLIACSSAGTPPVTGKGATIDDYIASLPYLPAAAPSVDMTTASPPQPDGDYSCSTQRFQETRQYDRVVAYAANSLSLIHI